MTSFHSALPNDDADDRNRCWQCGEEVFDVFRDRRGRVIGHGLIDIVTRSGRRVHVMTCDFREPLWLRFLRWLVR